MQKKKYKIPRKVLIELISSIPENEFEEILEEVKSLKKTGIGRSETKLISPSKFDHLIGLVRLGGDAFRDTEVYYE